MTSQQFNILLSKWLDNTITEQEAREFIHAAKSGAFDAMLGDHLETDLQAEWFNKSTDGERKLEAWNNIKTTVEHAPPTPVQQIHFLSATWLRVAVAVLIFIGIGAYLLLNPSQDKLNMARTITVPANGDMMPGGNKAILELADGSTIKLNDVPSGKLAQQSGAEIIKSADGKIIYSLNRSTTTFVPAMNTMRTPAGGQYELLLSDGSKVWLNAKSSITFPTAFNKATREVSVKGEVYFEVVRNKSKPFIVHTENESIEVLGTSFNVSNYTAQSGLKASLADGAIKINNKTLRPGQAYFKGDVVKTNITQDVAWKNGLFDFSDQPLSEAMEQIARWYDVEVEFRGDVSGIILGGRIQRKLRLSQVLNGLEDADVKFELSGKNLVVIKNK